MNVNTGLSESQRKEIVSHLSVVLANTYLLYLKTQNFHWNITGPQFHSLHEMFEKQYEALAEAVDELAERIRALGFHAPGSFAEFQSLATLKEAKEQPNADAMIKQLLADHDAIVCSIRHLVSKVEELNDPATEDILIGRMEYHEKTAWMLRSLL